MAGSPAVVLYCFLAEEPDPERSKVSAGSHRTEAAAGWVLKVRAPGQRGQRDKANSCFASPEAVTHQWGLVGGLKD